MSMHLVCSMNALAWITDIMSVFFLKEDSRHGITAIVGLYLEARYVHHGAQCDVHKAGTTGPAYCALLHAIIYSLQTAPPQMPTA